MSGCAGCSARRARAIKWLKVSMDRAKTLVQRLSPDNSTEGIIDGKVDDSQAKDVRGAGDPSRSD